MQKYYGLDGVKLTWSRFRSLLAEMTGVRRYLEDGVDPDDISTMGSGDLVRAILSGEVTREELDAPRPADPERARAEMRRVLGME